LLIGLAEPGRPGGCADLAHSAIDILEDKLGIKFHPRHSQSIAKGHTAGFECLRIARKLFIQDGIIPGCLVCGVDSYISAMSLLWLDQHWRLKRDEHSDGVIPGEAAAAVYLQRTLPAKQYAVEALGLGFGFEQAGVLTDKPLRGIGLANAAIEALADANLKIQEIEFRISDVTGESYGFKEQSCALQRLLREPRAVFPIWHNADSIGDTGAAAGICELVTAFHSFRSDYAPGRRVICYCSSVSGDRAVAILQA
jgi:3-oxoacyl-[acyl-carrier-protein] synthase-1